MGIAKGKKQFKRVLKTTQEWVFHYRYMKFLMSEPTKEECDKILNKFKLDVEKALIKNPRYENKIINGID